MLEQDFCVTDGKLFYIGEEADKEKKWQQLYTDRSPDPVQNFIKDSSCIMWENEMKIETPFYSVDQTVLPLIKKGLTYNVAWTFVKSPRSMGLFMISEVRLLVDKQLY